MVKMVLRKQTAPNGMPYIYPESEADIERFRKIPDGDLVMHDHKRNRNPQHHRKYWALINLVWQNQEYFKTADELHIAIKYAVGHTGKVETKSGTHEYPLPTDFAAMDQDAFNEFYDRVVNFIVETVIPGLNKDDLRAEIFELIGG